MASALGTISTIARNERVGENCFILLGRNALEGIEALVGNVKYGSRHVLSCLGHSIERSSLFVVK